MTKKAVLLVNLGSPDSPAVPDVRRYLREFLMDGRVLDAPWPIRFGIVNFAILPRRPHASSEAYRSIWTEQGSPLVVMSHRVRAALQGRLQIPVELAMRYQNPSIDSAIHRLARKQIEELLLVPLFPHYAMSSYETAVERVKDAVEKIAPQVRLHIQPPYYDAPDYIDALVESARPYLHDLGLLDRHDPAAARPSHRGVHLLFSFHGLPERHLKKADPTGCHCMKVKNCCEVPSPAHATCYRAQCLKTVRAFVANCGVPSGQFSVAFQSRLGREPWMQPYTDKEIERLARAGVKRLLVICPAFVSDCLETLEEIGMRGRELFLHAGGQELTLIPCLNEHARWIDALQRMVTAQWPASAGERSLESSREAGAHEARFPAFATG
jgi:ferrochelatase